MSILRRQALLLLGFGLAAGTARAAGTDTTKADGFPSLVAFGPGDLLTRSVCGLRSRTWRGTSTTGVPRFFCDGPAGGATAARTGPACRCKGHCATPHAAGRPTPTSGPASPLSI